MLQDHRTRQIRVLTTWVSGALQTTWHRLPQLPTTTSDASDAKNTHELNFTKILRQLASIHMPWFTSSCSDKFLGIIFLFLWLFILPGHYFNYFYLFTFLDKGLIVKLWLIFLRDVMLILVLNAELVFFLTFPHTFI